MLTVVEYYISINKTLNDGKGAGPFMYAATEIELLKGFDQQSQ